jgi:hypothetical protein
MDRSHFYEANKTDLSFFKIFYDFWQILQDLYLYFYRKREKLKKKKKHCMG